MYETKSGSALLVQRKCACGGDSGECAECRIPARVATGDIEWPQDQHSHPQLLPMPGIQHHYALFRVCGAGARMEDREVPTRIFARYATQQEKISRVFLCVNLLGP